MQGVVVTDKYSGENNTFKPVTEGLKINLDFKSVSVFHHYAAMYEVLLLFHCFFFLAMAGKTFFTLL
jgi:hypothetical protein